MRTYSVYVHTNIINGKKYVGITAQRVDLRWKNGRGYSGHNYFYRAIEKYGWGGFTHEVVAQNISRQEAQAMEIMLIDKFHSANRDFGYNGRLGGEANIPNDETCKKISQNHADISGENNPFYGKTHTQESREKNSNAHKGNVASEAARRKMSESRSGAKHCFYGKKFSDEYRMKISAAKKGKPLSRKNCEGLSAAWTPERRMAQSEKMKSGTAIRATVGVVCLSTGKKFDSIKSAAAYYGILPCNISSCCRGKRKSSGKSTDTGEMMVWAYSKKDLGGI